MSVDDKKNPVTSDTKIGVMKYILSHIQDQIRFADSKANISLSIQSLLISIGLGTSILANTFEHVQKLDNNYIICFFYFIVGTFIISYIVGVILSIFVYKARPPLDKTEQKRKGLLYFGHIAQFTTFEDFFSEVDCIDENRILEEFTRQVYQLSLIANKKMKYVNMSIYFLISNLFLTTIVIMFSGYISTL